MAAELFGIQVQEWTVDELHKVIGEAVETDSSIEILNVNIHAMNLSFKDREFYEILRSTDYVFCDGEGVRLALNRRGARVPYRITYADWMQEFLPFAQSQGLRLCFAGGRPGVAEKASDIVRERYPKLQIAGVCDGYLDEKEIFERVRDSGAQVLLTGMGMPLQEKWIRKYAKDLPCNVFLSGGAVLDYLSETVPRAPRFMCDHGLEWAYRLYLEPRRMFTRYIIGNPLFYWRVFRGIHPFEDSKN